MGKGKLGKTNSEEMPAPDPDGFRFKPKFDDFDGEDAKQYEAFKERVEIFFDVEVVDDQRKGKIFLNSIHPRLYEILRVLVSPVLPRLLTYKQLFGALDAHFVIKINRRAERFKFNRTVQQGGESFPDFVKRLREAAKDCKFGDFITESTSAGAQLRVSALEDALLDRFVMGVHNPTIQQRLLEKDPATLVDAINIAETMQVAIEEKASMQIKAISEEDLVNAVRAAGGTAGRCHRCGNQAHPIHQCPGRAVTCRRCGRVGHFERWCRNNTTRPAQVHAVRAESSAPLKLNLRINNHSLPVTVDTGACSNVISPQSIQKTQLGSNVTHSNSKLTSFAGHQLKVEGRTTAPVSTAANPPVQMSFEVVNTGRDYKPLIGRPGLDQLFKGWREFFAAGDASVTDDSTKCDLGELSTVDKVGVRNKELGEWQTRYPRVFDGDLTQSIVGFQVEIHLKEDHPAIFSKAYSLPIHKESSVKKELAVLVNTGTLEKLPISVAAKCRYASPMVSVTKADGISERICIDCKRTLNKYMINNSFYPLPSPDSIFTKLGKARVFCILDLKNAYQQLDLGARSRELLTINTPFGLYRYNKLPFGVSAAPSIFQSVIDQILQDLPLTQAYLDDIIIGGLTKEECRTNLDLVLARLEKYNVKVNGDKCQLFKTQVTYLGHLLSEGKIMVNGETLDAVINAQVPRNVKELQSYLGLINYFRSFAPGLSQRLQPLFNLLKKGVKFEWSSDCQAAFQKSKEIVTSESCLEIYRPERETLIWCDASPVGLSAVLVQKNDEGHEVPVCYASCTLSPAQQNYSQLHREGLAVIFGVKKYYKYVFGRPFTIVTDAQAIKDIFNPEKATAVVASARVQRWGVYLSSFDYKIVHRSSSRMWVPDALSRLPLKEQNVDLEDGMISCISKFPEGFPTFTEIVRETKIDPILMEVLMLCSKGFPRTYPKRCPALHNFFRLRNSLSIENGALYYRDRVIIPATLRTRILSLLHEGHKGMVLMKQAARKSVFWPLIDKDIESWIDSCKTCQLTSNRPKLNVASQWPPSSYPFERVHIDFCNFQGKTLFVLIDSFTKFISVKVMNGTATDRVVDVLEDIFNFYGYPTTLVSDNGPPFNSHRFTEYCEEAGIRVLFSPPYHPESNGLGEAAVKIVKDGLGKLALDHPRKKVDQWIKLFLVHYLNSSRSGGGGSPLERLFLYKPRSRLEVAVRPRPLEVNLGRYEEFEVGEEIYYKSKLKGNLKWQFGKIVEQESTCIYWIDLEGVSHRVHVSTLRKKKG